jgi:hypothetical protein
MEIAWSVQVDTFSTIMEFAVWWIKNASSSIPMSASVKTAILDIQ